MPAVMTHDFFGRDAFGAVLGSVELSTADERDAFLLGNQGPDPFFYLVLDPIGSRPYREVGSRLHHERPSRVLASLACAARDPYAGDEGVACAYVAGFLCHYLLDSTVHPFVYFWERGLTAAGVEGLDRGDSGRVHAEVERDLDEMVLFAKRHQTIRAYRPYEHVLLAQDRVLTRVGRLFAEQVAELSGAAVEEAAHAFPHAVECFRVAQRAFFAPDPLRLDLAGAIERAFSPSRYSLYRAMAHRVRAEETSDFDNRAHLPWENPFTGERSRASFWDLYEAALGRVTFSVEELLADGADERVARTITRGLDFSGEPVE